MTDIEYYNEKLVLLFGKNPIVNQPKYRLVRSELQTEKRYGSYDVLTQDTGIWLGVKQGLVEIKKYWYMKDCWLLERVEPNTNRKDILYDKYTYEPLYPFLDKDDNPLPVNWRLLEFMISKLEFAEKKAFKTEEDHRQEEEKSQKEESEKVFGILDAPDPTKALPTFTTSTLLG
jgi:hypothetical protein